MSTAPLAEADTAMEDQFTGAQQTAETKPKFNKLFSSFDAAGVIKYIKTMDCRRILVMTGAGISVAAGIPDFRSPGTGLYSNLAKYNLPYAEALFTLDYLRENPEVFFKVSKDMQLWPGSFAPTHVHHFIYQLQEQGRLMRAYTQNIDCLEREAGIDPALLVEAHGTFSSAHCIEKECKAKADLVDIRKTMDAGDIPRCSECKTGIVKPDVVFFGEGLPQRFFDCLDKDLSKADMVIVIGTSMAVMPFGSIAQLVDNDVPRVLINNNFVGNFKLHPTNGMSAVIREKVALKTAKASRMAASTAGGGDDDDGSGSSSSSDDDELTKEALIINSLVEEQDGLLYRDVYLTGDCQSVVLDLAEGLGFKGQLISRHDDMQKAMAEKKMQEVEQFL